MATNKRLGPEDDDEAIAATAYANKLPRIEVDGSGDLSNAAKKKLAGSARTSVACDRCKLRKIRCDARLGGCSPCAQNNTECRTTDRITGRATSRGYTENVEHENTSLKMYIIELKAQLKENKLEPRPQSHQTFGSDHESTSNGAAPYWAQSSHPWSQDESNANTHTGDRYAQQTSLLPDFRAGCIGDNYLGVASENNWLSPIEGTALALFGTKIDIAEFVPPEPDPTASAMSYQTFLIHAFGRSQPTTRPQLPDYEQCKIFAEWYFRSIQLFIPILHKPDFMDLLHRTFKEGYQPNAAETVTIHMVLAVMNFQWSARNGSEQSRNAAFEHYHFALSFIPQLITGHKLEDLQALTLICSMLRSQPRPGAGWMFTNMVLGIAVELGLHRSAKAWQSSAIEQDAHIVEMRKRIFWSLLVFHVSLSGKLGRPMPLRFEDFDIEIPEAVHDNLPNETGLSNWKKCSFRAAISGFKLLKIIMQVYSTIYSVRTLSGGQYDVTVRQLEKDIEVFQAQMPPELSGGPQTREEDRVSAIYLQMCVAECQLLLHHPSLCRSTSAQAANGHLDLCLQASNKLLISATHLMHLKSLDTTWYYATDYIAAIFTTLFAHTQRKDELNASDFERLRQDMDAWLAVMGEVGQMLGTGPKLHNAIRKIVDVSVDNIHRHLSNNSAFAASVAPGPAPEQARVTEPDPSTSYPSAYDVSKFYNNVIPQDSNGHRASDGHAISLPHTIDTPTAHPNQTLGQHAAGRFLGYAEPQAAVMPSYPQVHPAVYNAAMYGAEDSKPNIELQLAAELGHAHTHQSTPQSTLSAHPPPNAAYLNTFSPSPSAQGQFHAMSSPAMNGHQQYPPPGPAAWRDFTEAMVTNIGGQDYLSSAGALMALGGVAPKSDGSLPAGNMAINPALSNNMFDGMAAQNPAQQQWPLMDYNHAAHPNGR